MSTGDIMQAWNGHPVDELVAAWGEPDEEEVLGPDYRLLTWVSQDGACRQSFTVDGRQAIVGSSFEGCEE